MKNLFKTFTIAILLSGPSALAAQFEIFVAQPANEAASKSEFASLLQKSILIDTGAKTLKIPKNRDCNPFQLCSESIQWLVYTLTNAHFENRSPSQLVGVMGSSQILITTTPDHSTLIQIFNSKGSTEAQFFGSAAQPTRFLN
jgi:hypothetical protein